MKEITIYDIAKKLGISAASVSRALNGNKNISVATRKKVLDAADKMGYRVNNYARNLRNESSSKLIGVILHKLNSQFSINALYSMEQCIRRAGYDIIISHSSESHEQEIHNAENLFQRRVDGLIVGLASDTESMEHFSKYIDNEIPIVLFDRVRSDFPAVKVVLDNFNAAYAATVHLIQQGCKRIVHIAGKQTSSVYIDRLNGYKKALKDHKIRFRSELVLLRGVDAGAAPLLVKDILSISPMPDAVFAVNDLCAVLCMKLLQQAGLKVPGDIAFVGFNNDVISTLVEPNLTTVNYSGMEIGAIAGKAIIDEIQSTSKVINNLTITMHAELIVRASSKKK
jgi:LacI family transcriptional regulator